MQRVLIFTPFQAIERHAYPEAFFGNILKKEGWQVSTLGCNGFLSRFCVAHNALGLSEASSHEARQKVCTQCKINKKQMRGLFESNFDLEAFYDDTLNSVVERECARLTAAKDIFDFEFKGYKVGQIASYEFILGHKIFNVDEMPAEQLANFKIHLTNTLKVLLSVEHFFDEHQFDRVLLYNSGYSSNNMVRQIALRRGIPVGFMHAGFNLHHRYDSMYFSWKQITEYDRQTIDYFEENYSKIAHNYSNYPMVLSHFREQLSARSVFTYSHSRTNNSAGLFEKLGISSQHEKIILLSMSSSDEAYGADFAIMQMKYVKNAFRVFQTQLEWVSKVIEHFRDRPEVKLIVRPHPREFPNKREKVTSARAQEYFTLFERLPSNIVLDTPDLKNSIYDLFDIIDLHLVSQTTTGCESAMLGIPGVAYVTGLGNYPIETIYPVPSTEKEYFETVDKVLIEETTDHPKFRKQSELRRFTRVQRTLEWLLFLHNQPLINFHSRGYWNRITNDGLFNRIVRKLRNLIGLPRFRLRKYLNWTRIPEGERKVFLDFMRSGSRELVECRKNQKRVTDRILLQKYMTELFSLYYDIDSSQLKNVSLDPKLNKVGTSLRHLESDF